jgi:hypothetical protein
MTRKAELAGILLAGFVSLNLLSACSSSPQVQQVLDYEDFSLEPGDLARHGVAFITPSSITGHEQDRQTVAFIFAKILREERPGIPVVTLAETLSDINAAGMTDEYREMLNHVDVTGVLPADSLARLREATGARYVVKLNLASFESESSRRFGLFSIRLVTTRIATLRLFYQVWDTEKGTIAWEANQEMTVAFDTFKEEKVTFEHMVTRIARDLIARMPYPCDDDPTRECPSPGLAETTDAGADADGEG